MKTDLIGAIEQETKYHKSRNYPDFGMVLFCPLYSDSFIELLECDDFMAPVESAIGKHSILYSYTSTSMPPSEGNYSSRIHNDCHHTIPDGYITKFQTLIALDDFTLENGATYILPGSHKIATEPTKDEFYKHAERLTMKAGSVWYAHAKIWHAGGTNTTDKWRHAVTSVFCRSYMKQRLDIPRLLAGREATLSQVALQKLGFLAQVPISYDEYYAPPEQRKFRQPLD
jgi:ectoine hydroxylase-related dioxygenase (phytanoyl-CoA dioxygenase family)